MLLHFIRSNSHSPDVGVKSARETYYLTHSSLEHTRLANVTMCLDLEWKMLLKFLVQPVKPNPLMAFYDFSFTSASAFVCFKTWDFWDFLDLKIDNNLTYFRLKSKLIKANDKITNKFYFAHVFLITVFHALGLKKFPKKFKKQ